MGNIERRRYERYNTEAKIYFQVAYSLETLVKFQVVDKDKNLLSEKYSALSRDLSADGVCFISGRKLEKGDGLLLELYLPKQATPISMTGEVHWSEPVPDKKDPLEFATGVKLISVDGKPVAESIFFDEEHKMVWSTALESVFGNFRKFAQERANPKRP